MRLRILLLAATTVLAGCARDAQSPGLAGSFPAGSVKPAILFRTTDGWGIAGDFTQPPGASKAVILLHQRGGSAADWQPVLSRLNDEGFATLAIDQRGAGRSTGPQNGNNAPWDTSGDIAGAVAFLSQKGIKSGRIGIAGASYGANNALLYAAKHPEVAAVALLSPGKDYNGLAIEGKAKYVRGSLLVMTAKEDTITEGGPEIIKQDAPGAELQEYSGSAHGTALFTADRETPDKLAAFFKRSIYR